MADPRKRLPYELMGYLKSIESRARLGNLIREETLKQSLCENVTISGIIDTAKHYKLGDDTIVKNLDLYIHKEEFGKTKKKIVFDPITKEEILDTIGLLNTIERKINNRPLIGFLIVYYCKQWKLY